MTSEGDSIKYSDIIQPDGSLDNLINKLDEISKSYAAAVETIKAGTDKIASSLNSASGATKKGKEIISETAEAANRLERAYRELTIAESEEGKMIAQLKALTQDANKASVAELRALEAKVGSYNKLQQELKEYVSLYKSLTAAEREDAAMGKELINQILEYKNQIKALDAELKPHIEQLTKVQKAEQELAFLRSAEGQQLLALQKQIRAVKAEYANEKAAVDPLVAAKEKLAYAQTKEYKELQLLSHETQKQQKIAALSAVVATAKKDSYEQLSAAYALGKIRLAEYSQKELETSRDGQALVKHLDEVYAKMKLLQESTGYYGLGVGQYSRVFEGLSYSVAQIVRELPAAAINLNTFFLAISNNIPMLVDEINKLRKAGTSGISIVKGIGKAVFSWQTLLIAGLTALSMYGDEVVAWAGKLFKAKNAAVDLEKVQKDITKELESTTDNYGERVVSLKKLATAWTNLKSTAEKTQWLKDNKSEFNQLGLEVNNIVDAEAAFVTKTQDVLDAFKLRAKAAAATKLAAEKYEQSLAKQAELDKKRDAGATADDLIAARRAGMSISDIMSRTGRSDFSYEEVEPAFVIQQRALEIATARFDVEQKNINLLEAEADAYFAVANAATAEADAKLKAAGIYFGDPKGRKGGGRDGRDVSDLLNREELNAQKRYETSRTNLEREELIKRRKEAEAAYNAKVKAAENANAKLERILKNEDKDYKDLTESQKQQAQDTIAANTRAITSFEREYKKALDDIARDEEIFAIQHTLEMQQLRLKTLKEGSEEEYKLRQEILKNQRALALAQDAKLPPSQRQGAVAISAGYAKQSKLMVGERTTDVFDQQQALEKARFEAIAHSEYETTKFRLTQEGNRWLMLIRLAKAGALDWSDEQIAAAEATVEGIESKLGKLDRDNSFVGRVAEQGLFGAAFEKLGAALGMDDDDIQTAIGGFQLYSDQVLSGIQAIFDAEVELAEKEAELAAERVERAQSAYEAELEARNNGYASSVAAAKAELELEKKNQAEKQKLLAQAQKRQEAINSVVQASSLITASANLWSSLSIIPYIGPALAIAAIATMWGSFALAKVKAKQVTSQTYGEGGLEFLEGGSHASGNDIDLGVNNSRNKRMRAEGGEALAIINKKNTRRYKRILPDIIDSLNKGTFEDKYLNAFSQASDMTVIREVANINVERLEREVEKIRKQGETRYYTGNDGTIIEVKGNVKRIIKS